MSWTLTDQTVTLISILVSLIIVIWQIKSAKKRDIEFKVHQQRKQQYAKLIRLLIKTFSSIKNTTTPINEEENTDTKPIFTQDEYLDVQFGMSMYASEKVLKSYNFMMDQMRQKNEDLKLNIDPIVHTIRLGDLILMMRKEVDFEGSKNLTCRDVLSTFITDINDPKHDQYFK